MAYVFQRPAKDGKVRSTAMYKAENGKYRSAGTYDDEDRAQQVADRSERHGHLRLAETSPGEKATIIGSSHVRIPKMEAIADSGSMRLSRKWSRNTSRNMASGRAS